VVFIDADLDRYATAVVLVHHRVEQGLPQGSVGEQVGFQPLEPVVADVGLQVLGMQKLKGLLDLLEEAAPNLVLIPQIVIGDEKLDLGSPLP
jgi:hypothetical protein